MLKIEAEKRELTESSAELRQSGWVPAVVYGFQTENQPIKVSLKDFQKIYQEAGESTLVSVVVKEGDQEKGFPVLIQEVQRHPVSGQIIHADFYHPSEKKKIEASIPIVFEGESPAVHDFGGTVIKEMNEIEVKGLAIHLPHEIKVDLGALKEPHDRILVKDLSVNTQIELLADPESIVAMALPAEAVEEELEKSVDEEVTPVEKEEGEKEEAAEEAKEK